MINKWIIPVCAMALSESITLAYAKDMSKRYEQKPSAEHGSYHSRSHDLRVMQYRNAIRMATGREATPQEMQAFEEMTPEKQEWAILNMEDPSNAGGIR